MRSTCFYVTVSESFKHFESLKQIFWKKKTFFKKLKYRFLVETTEIKTHHFYSKLLCQKPMLRNKTNRLATTKWAYHKEWSFSSNYFLFFGKFVSVLEPLKKTYLMYQRPKCPYSYFWLAVEFSFRVLFPVSIFNISKLDIIWFRVTTPAFSCY